MCVCVCVWCGVCVVCVCVCVCGVCMCVCLCGCVWCVCVCICVCLGVWCVCVALRINKSPTQAATNSSYKHGSVSQQPFHWRAAHALKFFINSSHCASITARCISATVNCRQFTSKNASSSLVLQKKSSLA